MKNLCKTYLKILSLALCFNAWGEHQGPFALYLYLLPQNLSAPAPLLTPTKVYPVNTYCWSLRSETIPRLHKKALPSAALTHGHGFVIPAFEQTLQTTLVARSLLSLKPTSNSFTLFEDYPSALSLQRRPECKNYLGHAEFYPGPPHELKVSLNLQLEGYTIKMNQSIPLQQWIVIDNPHHAALIRITPLE